jgi:DNA-binding CsgD family transcriptional regulator
LTADPAARVRRALAAAEASFHAGAFDAALALTARADAGTLDDRQRARTDLLRGQVAFATGRLSDAAPLLLQAASRLETVDQDLARQTYMTAWGTAFITAHQRTERGVLLEICRAVRAIPPRPDGPRPLDLLLDGLALLATEGHAAAAPTLHQAAGALLDLSLEDVLQFGWVAVAASVLVWDHEAFGAIVTRQIQLVRDAGALAQLPLFLSQACKARTWIGDFAGAESFLAEAGTVATATGSRFPPYAALHLRAPQGREADAAAVISTALEQAAAGDRGAASHAHWASAVLNNGLRRYDDAAAAAQQAASNAVGDPFFSMWALPELVEAGARLGDNALASDALERLAATTQPAGTEFALGIEARSRALVSDGVAADDLYREAIARLDRARLRPELARAHLLFGEWLRERGRPADAREQLQAAQAMLDAIGMEAFAERARTELAAAGGVMPNRTSEPSGALTPQEEQIARLARDGLTNAEIGSQLFLSPRTVEWHLRKVFAKLAITSRNGLATALPADEPGAVPLS